uniref:Basic salivary proline-rich protein 1 n=1 Tax=Rhizophora mucronata TaxID=61149 RepID=A0A2P2JCP8_RHIMU
MTAAPMAASKAFVLEITIISAKHLKNVNWRNGDLKPYATFYLDYSEPRQATRVDDSGSTRPVWNERFTVPITRPVHESILTLEIFHSKPSETPKPLVGTVKFPLSLLIDSDESSSLSSSSSVVRKLELIRPSGRPQGKVRVKLAVKEAPMPPTMLDYANTPNYSHYYNPTPSPPLPPPPARDYREFSPSPYGYSDHYGYYSAYYPPPPPPPLTSRPMYSRLPNYSIPGGPSAPVDLSLSSSYDHKPPPALKTSSYMVPSGPSAPVDYSWPSATRGGSAAEVSSTMEGLSLEEENIYEKEKAADRGTYNYRREY